VRQENAPSHNRGALLLAASIAGLFLLPGPWNVILFALALVAEVGEIFLWIRFLGRYKVRGGVEGMIGERATVLEACDPDGLVRLRGEVWSASAEAADPLAEGERASVISVEGLRVIVRRSQK